MTADNYDKYRIYIFDEAGTGHYLPGDGTNKLTDPTSLDDVLGAPDPQTGKP